MKILIVSYKLSYQIQENVLIFKRIALGTINYKWLIFVLATQYINLAAVLRIMA